MPRDYKHRGRSKRRRQEPPGWQWMLAGLALGLVVAVGVYVYDRRPGGIVAQAAVRPMPAAGGDTADEDVEREDAGRFQFYELLPKFEVVIPERERGVAADAEPAKLTRPGSYVLQAGSFRNYADADRMQATLALLGVESRIQNITIDDDAWHRVRVGPIDDLDELARLRERLSNERIEVLVIRVGE